MRRTLTATAIALATQAGADTPVLTVYAGDYFTSEWGPGPIIEEAFEATCGCDLQFVGAGDGAAVLSRLRLEGIDAPVAEALPQPDGVDHLVDRVPLVVHRDEDA